MTRCPRHEEDPPEYPCADCATTKPPADDRTPAQQAADCPICDDDGRLASGLRCHHKPHLYAAAERGVAAARAELARRTP